MAEAEASIIAEPVWVDEAEIIIPMQAVPSKPETISISVGESPGIKGLIFNIETTGFDPLSERVITIGLQDPLNPEGQPTIIMLDDERAMIEGFFTLLDEGGYNQLIGYNLGFDFRFIFLRALYYMIPARQFMDCLLYDLMEIVTKGRFAYVYNPQKSPDLSGLADFLWGYPKPFTDLKMLEYYASGDLQRVLEFASGQITRTLALYLATRSISETLFISSSSGVESNISFGSSPPNENPTSALTIPEASAPATWFAKCPNDLSEWQVPISQSEFLCPIDGTIIKKGD